ncbi:MAG: hypothetical protein J6Y28_01665 [Acholeplasmatales bacterium]|nr:hypothetical protein [Methanobrevibacter sp.]MBP5444854.1 hypothetical protein [Acholeplasmatales bacterium]
MKKLLFLLLVFTSCKSNVYNFNDVVYEPCKVTYSTVTSYNNMYRYRLEVCDAKGTTHIIFTNSFLPVGSIYLIKKNN